MEVEYIDRSDAFRAVLSHRELELLARPADADNVIDRSIRAQLRTVANVALSRSPRRVPETPERSRWAARLECIQLALSPVAENGKHAAVDRDGRIAYTWETESEFCEGFFSMPCGSELER